MSERWLPLPGYEGIYEVSSEGSVRSLARRVQHGSWSRLAPGGVLTQSPSLRGGYRQVRLSRDGGGETRKVHALVLLAFVGPYPPGKQIRHLDGNPANNALSNLCYGTASENMYDKVRHGTDHNAVKTHCPKGHPYDESNTYLWKDNRRTCRTCRNDGHRRRSGMRVACEHCGKLMRRDSLREHRAVRHAKTGVDAGTVTAEVLAVGA